MADDAALYFDKTLAEIPLFSGLSKRQRARLLEQATVVEHPDGREIAREGKGALAMHVVIEGTATVTVRGRDVRTLRPGDYFGEISMIDGEPRSATVSGGESLRTLLVPHPAFKRLLRDDPAIAQQMLLLLCARLREVEAANAP